MTIASPLLGRLGLAETRVPHADRHGLLWLEHGNLVVGDGTLRFVCASSAEIDAGDYAIPYQGISIILLGPGTTITHDVLRVLARHGTLLAAVGSGGTKFYTAPPRGTDSSAIARRQVLLWAEPKSRLDVARRMYAIRFGEVLPHREIAVLRGIEGSRVKETYRVLAEQHGIQWNGRRYDRRNPGRADLPNQAINHAATFVEAAADVAVAAVGALPQLGFVHEDSSSAFVLDIADLYRAELTIPLAFEMAARLADRPNLSLEREIRRAAAAQFRRAHLIPSMIDRIKELLNADDGSRDDQRH